jgi:hypothetical protein
MLHARRSLEHADMAAANSPLRRDIMRIFRGAPAGLVASVMFVLGLFCAAGAVTYAGPIANELMLVNVQTGKCLTIAGGVSTENNVEAVQFNCDSDPSRTWRISDVTGSGVYQIRNVQTNKCVTIAGGVSTENNVTALQFDCDSHPSRTWTIRLKL